MDQLTDAGIGVLLFLDVKNRNNWQLVEVFRTKAVRDCVSSNGHGLNKSNTLVVRLDGANQVSLADGVYHFRRDCIGVSCVLVHELLQKFVVWWRWVIGAEVRASGESVSVVVLLASSIQEFEGVGGESS